MFYDTIIVGAGVSGLAAATKLVNAGKRVLILEKGRGLGGRMATRRWEGALLDHGAQFFTQTSSEFAVFLEKWKKQGLIEPWFQKGSPVTKTWISKEGMTRTPKAFAEGLHVERSTKVISIHWSEEKHWRILSENEQEFLSRNLILTAPLPQSLQLWATTDIPLGSEGDRLLQNVNYTRCLAGLFIIEESKRLPTPGYIKLDDDPVLIWIADNQAKGISKRPALTVHTSPSFSSDYWDEQNEIRLPLIEAALAKHVKVTILERSCHRWGFSHCINPVGARYWKHPKFPVAFSGDAFESARVEGAFLSGWSAADQFS